jgi:cobalt-zinc-cadmium efflux system outer membrane protein
MLNEQMPALGFLMKRVYVSALLVTVCVSNGLAQGALTWAELRDKFEAANPTLIAGRIGIDESKAAETTAYLRPNPNLTGVFDQIDPFTTQPPLNGGANSYNPFRYALPSGAVDYLHERQRKRELRKDKLCSKRRFSRWRKKTSRTSTRSSK